MAKKLKNQKVEQKKSDNKKYYLYASIIAITILVIVIFNFNLKSDAPSEHDELAKCLNDKGVKFYGAWWCPSCENQKKAFGNSFRFINYVECAESNRSQNKLCSDLNIESYPTWEFPDGTRVQGQIPLEILKDRAECSI